jgi:hypothetical protein
MWTELSWLLIHSKESADVLRPDATQIVTSLSDFLAARGFSRRTIQAPKIAMIIPCPKSPNITANRNGNVMIVYGAEK